jgi:hypothetical protein
MVARGSHSPAAGEGGRMKMSITFRLSLRAEENLGRTRGYVCFQEGAGLTLIGKKVLEYEVEPLRKAAVTLCGEGGDDVLKRRDAVQITNRTALCAKEAGLNFAHGNWALVEKARRGFGIAWRSERRVFVDSGHELVSRRSASGGLPLFLRFSGERSLQGGAGSGKAWRRGNDVGRRRLGFREQGCGRVDQSSGHFGGRHGRRLHGLMVIEHPSRKHCFGRFLDPLIHQGGNFFSQICSVVEPSQLITLQRGARSGLQIVERRSESGYGHGQSSTFRVGPKGPATEMIGEQY